MKISSLNHIYRLIWNVARQAWVVVSEFSSTKGKSKAVKRLAMVASCLTLPLSHMVYADVTGGVVTSGQGSIEQNGGVTNITQQSQTLNLNWDTFNIDQGQMVNFIQPNSQALAINMILDSNGSRILGHLNANGRVWLINPNGVFFGQSAQVNVGSILASTLNPLGPLNTREQSFGNGGQGSIVNQGTIHAANGGYVAFIANSVSNQGVIVANQGTVALAGGSQVTLTFADNQLYKVSVDQSTFNNLAENKQLIQANGGAVFLSAGAKQSLLASVVNNTGIIEAQTIENQAGKIVLLAGMKAGITQVEGTLDASAKTGNGGFIETSAALVNVSDNAKVTTKARSGKTGTWLIDPLDFTIAATGGNISGSAVSAALNLNDVKIETADATTSCTGVTACTSGVSGNGDIFVNDVIAWSSDTTLTLSAYRNINVNRTMSASGSNGKLMLAYGQGTVNGVINGETAQYQINAPVNLRAGQNFSTLLGSAGVQKDYTVITELGLEGSNSQTDLQGINGNLSGNYVLGANIDASATRVWSNGFKSIGGNDSFFDVDKFSGNFEGLGHVVTDLYINNESSYPTGLFGTVTQNATVQNLGLVNAQIKGSYEVGGVVGRNFGTISGSFVTGSVTGDYDVGGLAGVNGGLIRNSYMTGQVTAFDYVGGLLGSNYAYPPDASPVPGTLQNSYANAQLTILEGCEECGPAEKTGGLVGSNDFGSDPAIVTNSYWNSNTENTDNGVGTSLNNSQMTQASSFNGWSLDASGGTGQVWRIYAGHTAPLLRSFMTYTDLGTVTTVYNGNDQNPTSQVIQSLNPVYVAGNAANGENAGLYQNSDYYSSQLGYDFDGGNLQINKANATVIVTPYDTTYDGQNHVANYTISGVNGETGATVGIIDLSSTTHKDASIYSDSWQFAGSTNYNAIAATSLTNIIRPRMLNLEGSRAYDGTTTIANGVLAINTSQLVANETLGLTGNGTVSSKNASTTAQILAAANYVLQDGNNGGKASNYTLEGGSKTVTITQKAVTLSAAPVSKTYDGLLTYTTLATDLTTLSNQLLGGDTVTDATITYTDKNAGISNKSVTLDNVVINDTNNGNNYIVTTAGNSNSTINKANATVTANSNTVTYNGADQSVTGYQVQGLQGTDTQSALQVSTTGGSGRNAGEYTHIASGDAQNYNLSFVDGQLTIGKARLTYVADKVAVTQGLTPALSGTLTGFVGGDTFENVFANQTAVWVSPDYTGQQGVYPVLGSALSASNYGFVQAEENLVALTVTAPFASNTPDLTNQISNTQQPGLPPGSVPNNEPPLNIVNLNVSPASGNEDDDTLYDVIETFGCGV